MAESRVKESVHTVKMETNSMKLIDIVFLRKSKKFNLGGIDI